MRLFILSVVLLAADATAPGAELLFHAEAAASRQTVLSHRADTRFNPASVLKVATTLLAVERLGIEHRYSTVLTCRGTCEIKAGVLLGDLVISGGGDPDFHAENAWLMAAALNEAGVTGISGDLLVRGVFWMGWEQGVENRERDMDRLALQSGARFLDAVQPGRWNRSLRAIWRDAAPRMGIASDRAPAVAIAGAVGIAGIADQNEQLLLTHLSAPLKDILRRFNVFSNNDIVRIAEPLGGAPAIQARLRTLVDGLPGEVEVSTASGEWRNRMTARQVLKLLWALRDLGRKKGFEMREVLPVPGCDPGSIARMFPRLASGSTARTAVVKTGTLSNTDGGVAVLSGFFESAGKGLIAFCVAAPSAGGALQRWRLAEQEWLLDLMQATGGAVPRSCGPVLTYSESNAEIIVPSVCGNSD